MARPGGVDAWDYRVVGPEQLFLPSLGEVTAWHLKPEPLVDATRQHRGGNVVCPQPAVPAGAHPHQLQRREPHGPAGQHHRAALTALAAVGRSVRRCAVAFQGVLKTLRGQLTPCVAQHHLGAAQVVDQVARRLGALDAQTQWLCGRTHQVGELAHRKTFGISQRQARRLGGWPRVAAGQCSECRRLRQWTRPARQHRLDEATTGELGPAVPRGCPARRRAGQSQRSGACRPP